VLALHVLLLCAAGRTPTEIATFLFCSRTSVYRIVHAYHTRLRTARCEQPLSPGGGLTPAVRRSLSALLTKAPAVYGWCRTRWSCAALAAQLQLQRGIVISASTMRRWLHALGWVWKRAQLVARDDDPQRVEKLARIRHTWETLEKRAVLLFADELDIHLLPKVGYQWMPKSETVKLMTPGQNHKHYLAGALECHSGRLVHCTSPRKTNPLFRALLDHLEWRYPHAQFTKVYIVVDNYGIHKAKAVARWLAAHPRFELLYLPTYCPRANPIERAFGDVHDKCTRNHKRTLIADLVADVKAHLRWNGPWRYKLSELYYAPEVTAALAELNAAAQRRAA
jgi:transposase